MEMVAKNADIYFNPICSNVLKFTLHYINITCLNSTCTAYIHIMYKYLLIESRIRETIFIGLLTVTECCII